MRLTIQRAFRYDLQEGAWPRRTISASFASAYRLFARVRSSKGFGYSLVSPHIRVRQAFGYRIGKHLKAERSFGYNLLGPYATGRLARIERPGFFEERFSGLPSPEWQIEGPADRVAWEPDGVTLGPSDSPLVLWRTVPDGSWLLDVEIETDGVGPSDQAGLWFANLLGEQRALLTVEPARDTLPAQRPRFLRVARSGVLLAGASSSDGQRFVLEGVQSLPGLVRMGFIRLGGGMAPFRVRRLVWYPSAELTVAGLYPGMIAALVDAQGHVLVRAAASNAAEPVRLSLLSLGLPVQGYLAIYDRHGSLVAMSDADTFSGGDYWYFLLPLRLEVDGKELTSDSVTHVGTVAAYPLRVINPSEVPLPRLVLKLVGIDREEPYARFASDAGGAPGPERLLQYEIPSLSGHGEASLWLILRHPEDIFALSRERMRFDLRVEVG